MDVIGNPELTWRNQRILERQYGLRPVPVVHYRTDLEWLKFYMKKGYDVIGLGGLVGSHAGEECRKWIAAAFDIVCDNPERLPVQKLHGFGVTSYELMIRFPWYCMTEENHEVLTKTGWKSRKDLFIGQEILCYDDGKMVWQGIQDLPSFDVVDTEIIHLHNKKNKAIDAYVTPNHRWRVSNRTRTQQGWKETTSITSADCIPQVGEYADSPEIAAYRDDLVELAAWFWTEGYIKKGHKRRCKKSSVTITQSQSANPEKVRRIRFLLERLDERYCEHTSHHKGKNSLPESHVTTFELYGECRDWLLEMFPEKKISYEFILKLTKKQLNLFVDVSILADGHTRIMGCSTYTESFLRQKDRKNIDQFRLACLLAGYTTSEIASKTRHGPHPEIRACRTPENRYAWGGSLKREAIKYSGKLWCVQVPSQAFFTRCSGCVYVTGNSVDSTAWTKKGAYGYIMVPHKRAGKFTFDEQPYTITISELPKEDLLGGGLGVALMGRENAPLPYKSLKRAERLIVLEWLDFIAIPMGKNAPDGTIEEYGVINRHSERKAANLLFFEAMRNSLPDWPWPFTKNTGRRGFGLSV